MFRNSRIIGRRFRLVHIMYGAKIIETSTFRATPRHNGEGELLIRRDNVFGSETEDARRRDFTINGLFYDVASKQVIDYVGGLDDLDSQVIRTIGDPDIRFREDPVRMLRAIKFAARLGFDIEADTFEALWRHRADLEKCSIPRVNEEVYRLLRGGAARRSVELLRDTGVGAVLSPRLVALFGDDSPSPDGERSRAPGNSAAHTSGDRDHDRPDDGPDSDDPDDSADGDDPFDGDPEDTFDDTLDGDPEDTFDDTFDGDPEDTFDGDPEDTFDDTFDDPLDGDPTDTLDEQLSMSAEHPPEPMDAEEAAWWETWAPTNKLELSFVPNRAEVRRRQGLAWRMLDLLDELAAERRELSNSLLLATILSPFVCAELRDPELRLSELSPMLVEVGGDLMDELHVARRDADQVRMIMQSQRRFAQSRRRRKPGAFVRRDYFNDALTTCELLARVEGREPDDLEYWRELRRSEGIDDSERENSRRRRRRGGRRRRRGDVAAAGR